MLLRAAAYVSRLGLNDAPAKHMTANACLRPDIIRSIKQLKSKFMCPKLHAANQHARLNPR